MSELSPVELLRCNGQAFGHSIASGARNRRNPTRAVKEEVQHLRMNVMDLIESSDEHYAQVTRSINASFNHSDRLEFDVRKRNVRRVGERGILQWLSEASDKEFLEFAQWNVERRHSLFQNLEQDRDELTESALETANRLVDIGMFPVEALDNIKLAIDTYSPFAVMDSFESGAMQAAGYFDTHVISIANLYNEPILQLDISAQLEQTVFHELLHAAGHVGDAGFHFHKNPVHGRLWEEAFIAHSTAVAFSAKHLDPQPDIFDPLERKGNIDTTYQDERQIMGHFSSPDIANIPADLWADAFFDDGENKNQRNIARKLRLGFQAISSSEDAFETFNEAYEATYSPIGNERARSDLLFALDNQICRYRGIDVESLVENSSHAVSDSPIFELVAMEQARNVQ
jgi:hypothetical protein